MVRQYRYIDFQDRKEISTRYLNGDRVADIADGLGMAMLRRHDEELLDEIDERERQRQDDERRRNYD